MPLFWKPYKSEVTQFIEQLKAQRPTLEAEQRAGRALRQLDQQAFDLAEQRRHDRHCRADRDQGRDDRDRGGRERPRHTGALQAVDDGIEEVGDDCADHERQQDIVQQPEQ